MVYRRYQMGWVEVVCGCMFSGKTEELIRRVHRAQIARQPVQVFQHSLDERYGRRRIAAHSGSYVEATTVQRAADILALLRPDTEVVAIDEAQFFDLGLAEICVGLADEGLRVVAAGLDMDFRGEPFGPMPDLMARADLVDKLQAICVVCGAPAGRTQRLVDGQPAWYEDPIILVGASDHYEARCRSCHQVPKRGNGHEPST